MPEWLQKLLGRSEGTPAAAGIPIRSATADATASPTRKSQIREALSTRIQPEMRASTPTTATPAVQRAVAREEAAERAGFGTPYRAYRHFQGELSPWLTFGLTALPGVRNIRGSAPEDIAALREAGLYDRPQDTEAAALAEAATFLAPFIGVGINRGSRAGVGAIKRALTPPRSVGTTGERVLESRVRRGLMTAPEPYRAPLMELPNTRASQLPKGAPEALGGAVPREGASWLDMALYLNDRAQYKDAARYLRRFTGGNP